MGRGWWRSVHSTPQVAGRAPQVEGGEARPARRAPFAYTFMIIADLPSLMMSPEFYCDSLSTSDELSY